MFGFCISYVIFSSFFSSKLNVEIRKVEYLESKTERYKLQVNTLLETNSKLDAIHNECRTILRQALEQFDYIQPRPIEVK